MLPVQHLGLTNALAVLAPLQQQDTEVRLRVELADGSVLDGTLLSASADHLALRLPQAQARHIPVVEIRSVHQAVRRPVRELALLTVPILGATAAIVGIAQVPLLRAHLPRAVSILVLFGVALASLVVAKTGLRDWITGWKTLFDSHEH